MDQNKIWGVPGLNFRPTVIPSIHNDLPRSVEHKALPILFADDTSFLLTSPNNIQMQSDLNFVFEQRNKWFESNQLFFLILTELILFNFLIKVNAPLIYKLNTKINN